MNLRALLPLTLPLVFALIVAVFAVQAPGFLSAGNLHSLLLNNFVLLAIVAIGMTYAVAAGGIDLSVGTALDFASFSFVVLLNGGHGWAVAATGALVAALLVGGVQCRLDRRVAHQPFPGDPGDVVYRHQHPAVAVGRRSADLYRPGREA
jgi:ribose transport system permease protein